MEDVEEDLSSKTGKAADAGEKAFSLDQSESSFPGFDLDDNGDGVVDDNDNIVNLEEEKPRPHSVKPKMKRHEQGS